MKDVRFTSEPREGKEAFAAIDLKTYTKRVFSMFGGKQERVVIRFINARYSQKPQSRAGFFKSRASSSSV